MSKKAKILIAAYLTAALLCFGLLVWNGRNSLADYRLAALYSASRAFDEAADSVEKLSGALEKSLYATDSGMCAKVCAEAYANALAAETALSALPFSTQELEQLSAFINLSGDYAYSLSCQLSEEGFGDEQRGTLGEMSLTATEFSRFLRELQGCLNDGTVIMDSREARLGNVGRENELDTLSRRLLSYEEEFIPMVEPVYDGKYGKAREKAAESQYTQEELIELAARFTGVEPSQLQKQYDYEGSGKSCYRAGDRLVCLGPDGVESISGTRLVSEARLSQEEAERAGAEYLEKQGYENLELQESRISGAVAYLSYGSLENEAVNLDNRIKLSIALDDGSVYGFDCTDYSPEHSEAEWSVSEEEAAKALPRNLKSAGSRRIIKKSPGGKELPCYEFSCADEKGRGVSILVNAETGRQCEIIMEKERA